MVIILINSQTWWASNGRNKLGLGIKRFEAITFIQN